jgi:hypothetical protein
MQEQGASVTSLSPADNYLHLYVKDKAGVSTLYWKDDADVEHDLSVAEAHNLLSSVHTDTLAGTVVRGDLVVGNSTPKWSRFAKGSSGTVLMMGANDPAWTDPTETIQDAIGGILVDSSSIDFTYNDATPSITAVVLPAGVDHNALANLTTGDPHTQYRLESADHSHQSTGLQAGKIDHGAALDGLADDDHTQYVLRSILTTNGDIFVRLSGVVDRLGVGSNGDVLTISSGLPVWSAAGGGTAHNILSATHSDSFSTDTPADGDVLTWVDSNSRWEAVAPTGGGGGGGTSEFHPFLLMGA